MMFAHSCKVQKIHALTQTKSSGFVSDPFCSRSVTLPFASTLPCNRMPALLLNAHPMLCRSIVLTAIMKEHS